MNTLLCLRLISKFNDNFAVQALFSNVSQVSEIVPLIL